MESTPVAGYETEMYHVRRSVKYHDYRRRFFDNVLNFSLFLALLSGPAIVILSGGESVAGVYAQSPAIITSIFAGVALVSKTSAKVMLHNDLKTEFIQLRREMELGRATATAEDVAKWTAERLRIEMREPPINRVIDALCHNEVVQSLGIEEKTEYVRVLKWHRLVGSFTRQFDSSLRHYEEDDKVSIWVSAYPLSRN